MITNHIKFAVVSHHSREQMARSLAYQLGVDAHIFVDAGDHGANWNHRRALEWAADQDCRVVVIEDDAILTENFNHHVAYWLRQFPDALISFYLGTGRPPQYQMQIAERLITADKNREDFITLPRLIHGVCYSVPAHRIGRVLAHWDHIKPADYAVGDAFGGPVVYPCWSLVDHTDGEPVEHHPDSAPRKERRRAWRLA